MTECRDLPLNILIVAPRPVSEDAALSREHLEVLYDVLEEQRDHIEMTYLWPVTGDALRDALAVGGEPSYDVVILDAATTDLGPLVGVRMSDAVIPLDHVVGPAAEHGVALLVTRLTVYPRSYVWRR